MQSKAELQGARYAVLSEDNRNMAEVVSVSGLEPEGCSNDAPSCAVPPPVLAQLLQSNSIFDLKSLEQKGQWQACSYTLNVGETPFFDGNGAVPASQLKALTEALTSKIMQCAPNVRLPEEGIVFRPFTVDNATYEATLQWIQHLTVHSPIKSSVAPKRSATSAAVKSDAPKRVKISAAPAEKKAGMPSGGEVKSLLELDRELNKAAHQRMFNRMYLASDPEEGRSCMDLMALQEAERMLEMARAQLEDKQEAETAATEGCGQLETQLRNRRRECGEEHLQIEERMKALQAEVARAQEEGKQGHLEGSRNLAEDEHLDIVLRGDR